MKLSVYIQILFKGNPEESKLYEDITVKDLTKEIDGWKKTLDQYDSKDYSLELEYVDGDTKDFDKAYSYMMKITEGLLKFAIEEAKAKKKLKVDPMTGKKVIKWKCPPKSKLDSSTNPPACVKMKPDEIIAKKKAMKKAVKTRKQGKEMKDKTAQLKRKRTLKIRKSLGLDKK